MESLTRMTVKFVLGWIAIGALALLAVNWVT
jgi:hypothetical protein